MMTKDLYVPKGCKSEKLNECEVLNIYEGHSFTYYLLKCDDAMYNDIITELLAQLPETILFFDMDGVIAEFDETAKWSELIDPKCRYYYYCKGMPNSIEALKILISQYESGEINFAAGINSKVIGLEQAIDKDLWLYERNIDCPTWFTPYNEEKPIREQDFLLDDFSENLHGTKGTGIKMYNAINGRHGTWHGYSVHHLMDGRIMANVLRNIVCTASEIVAKHEYEHNDGDQIWTDTTTFYRNGNGSYTRVFEDGYDGRISKYNMTEDMVKLHMNEVRKKCNAQDKNCRGGFTILLDLPEERCAATARMTQAAAVEKLQTTCRTGDEKEDRELAKCVIVSFLRSNGYKTLVDAWNKVGEYTAKDWEEFEGNN